MFRFKELPEDILWNGAKKAAKPNLSIRAGASCQKYSKQYVWTLSNT